MAELVVGLSASSRSVRNAVEMLRHAALRHVAVLTVHAPGGVMESFPELRVIGEESGWPLAEAAACGGAVGSLASAATMAVPFVGPIIYTAALPAAVVTGALLGAVAGGSSSEELENSIALALGESGVPDHEIPRFSEALRAGRYLISVRCHQPGERRRADSALLDAGTESIHLYTLDSTEE